MSIEKYTTEAFILKEYEQGESDMVYKMWTREFGIVFVLARSIRKVHAKLRMMTKKHDFLSVTLVRGKDVWRLVGVEELSGMDNEKSSLEIKKNIAEIVDKFIEEKKSYKKLFDKLKSLLALENLNFKINKLKIRILIYYLVLVDTGYADAKIIGARDIEEYKNFSTQDFYTHFVLNEKEVRDHVVFVLKNSML